MSKERAGLALKYEEERVFNCYMQHKYPHPNQRSRQSASTEKPRVGEVLPIVPQR
jgi:hypothetical protein